MTIPFMVIGWIRWAVILFLVLTLIYGILTLTNRSKEKDRLRAAYAGTDKSHTEKEYLEQGMVRYNKSLKAKLLLGVYLFPLAVFGILVYFAHV